ncbi:hypothetical protein FGB62_139g26 [Gracilaria domingensis]|nr:hypothetical protein FGB62_139g26 [Gracilaria domingensis]
MSRLLFALSIGVLFALAHSQTLQIYQASVPGPIAGWPAGPVLPADITLCQDDLPSPFTVVCFPPEGVSVSYARFYLNREMVRTERVAPYVITGDVSGSGAFPWNNPPAVSEITCRLSGGQNVTSTISFSCGGSAPSMAPPATMPATTTMAQTTTAAPPTTPAVVMPRAATGSGCVYMPATGYDSKTGAWIEGGGGMQYKFDDPSRKTDKPDAAVMTYSFVAPITGRFAITVDMLTSHGTEHNDIWIEIEGVPFRLVKKNSSQDGKSGMNKAYHNRNGRSKIVYTVDFDAHVFSTKGDLQAGETYTVKIGGRSTKVRVYAIILFPCEAFSCAPGNEWNGAMNSCSA